MDTRYLRTRGTAAPARWSWLGLLLVVSACAPYYQQPPSPALGPRGDLIYNIERYAPELKLTREQIQKIRQLRTNFEKEAIRLDAALRGASLDLDGLTRQDRKNFDKQKAFKKVDEISRLHAQMQRHLIELEMAVTDLLTDEQYNRYRDILK